MNGPKISIEKIKQLNSLLYRLLVFSKPSPVTMCVYAPVIEETL